MLRLGLLGARGYVGAELLRLVARHGGFSLELATSGEAAGKRVGDVIEGTPFDVRFSKPDPAAAAALELDVAVLALANGESPRWVEAFQERSPRTVLLDLGADHRFDPSWMYGQPERFRARLRGATRIANPGCYATAAQLAIAPLLGRLEGPVNVFGVSGYSGAGATPSPRNDPAALKDNVMPYALVGHTHERELSAHLGIPVYFMPHVAPFFRGVTVTVSFQLRAMESLSALASAYEERWGKEPLVRLSKEAPLVRDVVGRHEVRIGGLVVSEDGRHAVVVATVDNLLGGAATQALRNLNLATGQDELRGIEP